MRYLIGFKPFLRDLIPSGMKTETMRGNKRWLKVKKGDEIYVKGKGMMSGYNDACMVLVATKDAIKTRVQETTHENAIAEGFSCTGGLRVVWGKINKKKPKRWEDNPTVARLTFRFDRMLK